MKKLIISLVLILMSSSLIAQCPATISSLGNGNGIQACWERGQRPDVDTIWYDGVAYAGGAVNGGQGDCWRSFDPATLNILGNHELTFIDNGVTNVCPYNDGDLDVPFDIELDYYESDVKGGLPTISWFCKQAMNVKIYRSRDGVNFKQVHESNQRGGTFVDHVKDGVWYYKLVITDGKHTFTSDVKAVKVENSQQVFHDNSTIKLLEISKITLHDYRGICIAKSHDNQMDISYLPSGPYLLVIDGIAHQIIKS